ncbi:hypothetical protein D9M68_927720 [compost metagenome]
MAIVAASPALDRQLVVSAIDAQDEIISTTGKADIGRRNSCSETNRIDIAVRVRNIGNRVVPVA